MPFQRCLAPAKQSWLICDDLDENPIAHSGMTNQRLNCCNLHAFLEFQRLAEFVGIWPRMRLQTCCRQTYSWMLESDRLHISGGMQGLVGLSNALQRRRRSR